MKPTKQMAIWSRVIAPEEQELPPEVAQYLLRTGFREADQQRIDALSAKARAGTLTGDERDELDEYVRINHFLTVLHSSARRRVRSTRGVA